MISLTGVVLLISLPVPGRSSRGEAAAISDVAGWLRRPMPQDD